MPDNQFAYAWRYTIDPDHEQPFLAAYAPDGTWADFFRQDPGYLRTVLLRDVERPDCFVTIDYWQSKNARDAFRKTNASRFEEIDQQCEAYTIDETFIGDFLVVDG